MTSTWLYLEVTWQGLPLRFQPQVQVLDQGAELLAAALARPSDVMVDVVAQQSAVWDLLKVVLPFAEAQQAADGRLRGVIDYITHHLSMPITRGELAALTGLSETRFHDVFKQALGIAPMRYVLNQRLQRASESIDAFNV